MKKINDFIWSTGRIKFFQEVMIYIIAMEEVLQRVEILPEVCQKRVLL